VILKTQIVTYIAKRFAIDVIAPKVKEMDESEQMDLRIISSLFENGVKKFNLIYFN
jgi:short-chain 2-methylacyl-CoA dehydrogenase